MEIKKETGIAKNLAQIVRQSYVIPFYQRNFNWGDGEITQLLQDIYDSFSNDYNQNYYIGSLVVFKRDSSNTRFEVIDGQQRLTAIHIIVRLMFDDCSAFSKLKYDSRREVEEFFDRLTKESFAITQREDDFEQSNLSNFFSAVETINHAKLDGEVNSELSISSLRTKKQLDKFANYFLNKVMLVEVEMPSDTDVANYFEIMNNRGRQLQEHEILKAQLMSRITNSKHRSIFGNVWDACSQMDTPIQKFFNPEQRKALFGEYYDTYHPKQLNKLEYNTTKNQSYSILEILNGKAVNTLEPSKGEIEEELDEEFKYTAIIDFTNFLIHVLKLTYTDDEIDIPLSSDKLLKIFKKIPPQTKEKVKPMELLENILFYRIVFDRFVVKSEVGSENRDEYEGINANNSEPDSKSRWMLKMPVMYLKNASYNKRRYPSLNFKNTFSEEDYQKRLVKLLSMLQTTYRQRKNKNYLQYILNMFKSNKPVTLEISAKDFLQQVESFALDQFDKLKLDEFLELDKNQSLEENSLYHNGTNTPHFIFNFIDYLLWVDIVWNKKVLDYEDFDFTYRNSIEHHYPQALKEHLKTNVVTDKNITLNCLGNLCLVSKGANSKLNDREPLGKAADQRFNLSNLTPKRRIMYKITNSNKSWNEKEIIDHHLEITDLLRRRVEILGLQ